MEGEFQKTLSDNSFQTGIANANTAHKNCSINVDEDTAMCNDLEDSEKWSEDEDLDKLCCTPLTPEHQLPIYSENWSEDEELEKLCSTPKRQLPNSSSCPMPSFFNEKTTDSNPIKMEYFETKDIHTLMQEDSRGKLIIDMLDSLFKIKLEGRMDDNLRLMYNKLRKAFDERKQQLLEKKNMEEKEHIFNLIHTQSQCQNFPTIPSTIVDTQFGPSPSASGSQVWHCMFLRMETLKLLDF